MTGSGIAVSRQEPGRETIREYIDRLCEDAARGRAVAFFVVLLAFMVMGLGMVVAMMGIM